MAFWEVLVSEPPNLPNKSGLQASTRSHRETCKLNRYREIWHQRTQVAAPGEWDHEQWKEF